MGIPESSKIIVYSRSEENALLIISRLSNTFCSYEFNYVKRFDASLIEPIYPAAVLSDETETSHCSKLTDFCTANKIPLIFYGIMDAAAVRSLFKKGAFDVIGSESSSAVAEALKEALVKREVLNEPDIKLVEEAIRDNELHRAIIESLAEGLLIIDREDNILFANTRAQEMTGYSFDELVGQCAYRLLIPPDQWHFMLEQNNSRIKGNLNTYELIMRRKDGKFFNAQVNGSPYRDKTGRIMGTIGAINDISAIKAADKALQKSENRYRSVVKNVREVIFQTDENGYITFLNPFWSELTGFTIEESLGRKLLDFIHPEDHKKTIKQFIRIVYNKLKFVKYEVRCRCSNGEYRWIEINSRLTIDRDHKITGTSGTISDQHERKLAETELIKAKEKAEESDRLKSVFLAQMSHEIRTPLNIILSYNAILEDEINRRHDNSLNDLFSAIKNGGKRLLRTIDLILNMSMLQTGGYTVNKKELLIDRLLCRLVDEFNSLAAEKRLLLKFRSEVTDYPVTADEHTITQVFQNLIDNAIKYTHQGAVEVGIFKNGGGKIAIQVSDTGIGISQEYLPDIFKPFSQEETGYSRRFEGNGLGLALTKKYADLNDAAIEITSTKGEGTTVRVEI